MSKVPAYICKNRHGTYYFRVVLPINSSDHHAHKRKEIRKSLKTDSKKLAIQRARKLRVCFDQCLEGTGYMKIDDELDGLKEIFMDVIRLLYGDHLGIPPKNKTERSIDRQQITSEIGKTAIKESLESENSLSKLIQQYLNEGEVKESWSASTLRSYKETLNLYMVIVGDKPIDSIRYEEIQKYSDVICKLPSNRSIKAKYRSKSVEELTEINIPKDDLISPTTICNINRSVKTFYSWCVRKGKLQTNYSTAITDPKRKRKLEPPLFTAPDIGTILSGIIYKGDKPRGAHKWDASKFWLPLLALYTGARREELAQLHTKDVVEVDGKLFIKIDDDTEDKHIKNNASRRYVPIHSKLIDFGFNDFIGDLVKSKTKRLFPALTKNQNGKYGDSYGKHFNNYLKSIGVKERGKNFHSFRSTFISNLANNGVNREIREKIVGHSGGNVHSDTYTSLKESLSAEIEKLDYKMDMNHISWDWYKLNRIK